jgi:hypothetical protein
VRDSLREAGVETLDLAPLFTANRAGAHGPMFCATDTHWSGSACVLAAQEIARTIRSTTALSATSFAGLTTVKEVTGAAPLEVSSTWPEGSRSV